MKNIGLILMTLLLAAGGYFLKVKSDQVGELNQQLSERNSTLTELKKRLKDLDSKVHADESALQADQARLASVAAATAANTAGLQAQLTQAQSALSAESARLKALRDQELTLNSSKHSADDPSLPGHIQNAQARMKQIDQQLKSLENGEKVRKGTNGTDAKQYHAEMKASEKAVENQIKDARSQIKALNKQIGDVKKNRFDPGRDMKAKDLQTQIDAGNQNVLALEQQLQALKVKEESDSQSNSYEQQQKGNYAQDQRSALQQEKNSVQADLANMTSRNGLVKRDTGDIEKQIAGVKAQEHESDLKIQSLTQTINTLRQQIAASPTIPAVAAPTVVH